ncbi:hypothetical protein SLNWT_2874 [Streptomyces albus]|uniref:Uncharacterized protein n=1 Tax=Streptomyces albus (strain ATCC 21838 / DSM 41398 / FERM P-419 / JCM 4703 / NBRC 107858) TaxID=1081613 RepID=A0A0B5EVI5_STRA4|nr:hypothetical protein SLNWT_2874 [Streptomyces albus]AOU77564.1 hypothetical protein SLNHY_2873 [Streptomyces albus]
MMAGVSPWPAGTSSRTIELEQLSATGDRRDLLLSARRRQLE